MKSRRLRISRIQPESRCQYPPLHLPVPLPFLRLHGRWPFHDDRTPSLVITPAKNLWHCLGACQAGGTVIDWVMRAEGVSFRHAVELLVNDSLPQATASGSMSPPPKHSTVRKLPQTLARNLEDAKLLGQVIEYYHETLLASPEALDHLQRRGIGSEEAHPRFCAS